MTRTVSPAAFALVLAACGGASASGTPQPQATVPATRVTADSSASTLIPPGLGRLRQDDIAIVLEPEGVRVSAIPLDESVIRALAPDSYRTLHANLENKRQLIVRRASMRGIREPRVWYVTFYGLAADARFTPTDLTVTSGGREYRPVDVVPITPGFGEQRLQPREQQSGLLVFEEGLDVSQPVVVSMGAERNTNWDWNGANSILRRLDTERARIRALPPVRTPTP
jgi:hypothetical protein